MPKLNVTLPEFIKKLSKSFSDHRGTAYLVGGAVLDVLSNRKVKDWDMEVFGLSYDQISQVASQFGESDLIGNKFGVVKLKSEEFDVEIAVPRIENKNGLRHKDFDIQLVPDLSLFDAARRRDFTMNSLYLEIDNNMLHDLFGGYYDYRRGIVQHIDAKTFVEDPLRCFRAMQLVARKGKRVTHDTVQLCKSMKEDCSHLSGDAIFAEFVKLLMLSDKPDKGLRFLVWSELIDLFPELKALIDCKQNPVHHQEGSAFEHTLMVIREAAKYRDAIPEEWRLAYMFGMLLHDVGKPAATDPVTLKAIGHDKLGKPLAKTFMERLTRDKDLIDKVKRIVRAHMRPLIYLKDGSKASAWRKLHNLCPLNILAYVAMADNNGRGISRSHRFSEEDTMFQTIMKMHELIGSHKGDIPSVLMGRHLIEAGFKPGKYFSAMLAKAYEFQLETGCDDIEKLLEIATNEKTI